MRNSRSNNIDSYKVSIGTLKDNNADNILEANNDSSQQQPPRKKRKGAKRKDKNNREREKKRKLVSQIQNNDRDTTNDIDT